MRLWTAEKLAAFSGATNLAGVWLSYYARALGVQLAAGVDLHSLPPVTGMLRIGKGAAVEPEVDLSGNWVDGDVVHIGRIRNGAGATVGARATLLPGARIGKRAEIAPGSCVVGAVPAGGRVSGGAGDRPGAGAGAPGGARATLLPGARIGKRAEIAPGSCVVGAVPAGQRFAGVPANRTGRAAHRWPDRRPPRTRRWTLAYGVTSLVLGFLPVLAALPGLVVLGRFLRGTPTLAAALRGALAGVPLAASITLLGYALLVLVCVRLLGIGLRAGYHPVHGRVAWQAWTTERLMNMARVALFPLYASLFTPVWMRALGMRVGRRGEISTVVAPPTPTRAGHHALLAH